MKMEKIPWRKLDHEGNQFCFPMNRFQIEMNAQISALVLQRPYLLTRI